VENSGPPPDGGVPPPVHSIRSSYPEGEVLAWQTKFFPACPIIGAPVGSVIMTAMSRASSRVTRKVMDLDFAAKGSSLGTGVTVTEEGFASAPPACPASARTTLAVADVLPCET